MTRKRWAVSPVLVDEAIPEHVRQELVDTTDDGLMAVIVELNLEAGVPPTEVANRFKALLAGVLGDDRAGGRSYEISTGYQRCLLRREEITELLMADHDNRDDVGRRAIFRIWPDYVIRPQIDLLQHDQGRRRLAHLRRERRRDRLGCPRYRHRRRPPAFQRGYA